MDAANSSAAQRSVRTPSGRIAYIEQGTGPGRVVRARRAAERAPVAASACAAVATSGAASRSICWRTAAPKSRRTRTYRRRRTRTCCGSFSMRWTSSRSTSSATTAAAASRRFSPRYIPSASAASRSPTATRTTTGRPRRSSPSSRWRPPAVCAERSRRCCRDKSVYRSPEALGPAYEHPERVTDDTIEAYLRPLVAHRAAHARPRALPRGLRQRAHGRHRGPAEDAAGADTDRLGNRRRLLRREVVALAGRDDSRHAATRRARGRENLFPRGTLGGVQPGAARTLAGEFGRSQHKYKNNCPTFNDIQIAPSSSASASSLKYSRDVAQISRSRSLCLPRRARARDAAASRRNTGENRYSADR